MGESTGKAILGFLVGAATGAALGLLFAPDKGELTRKRIARQASDLSSNVKDGIDESVEDMKKYVTNVVDDVKERFSKIEKDVKENKEKLKDKAKATSKAATS